MPLPSISIALATFNGARFLGAQLESLAAQTYPPREIVVGDDGSTDDTLKMLDEFSRRSFIPVHVHRNATRLGYGENFLSTASRCRGDWVSFCDQDDFWLPEKLSTVARVVAAHPGANAVIHDAIISDTTLMRRGPRLHRFRTEREEEPLEGAPTDYYGFCISIRRSLLTDFPTTNRPQGPDRKQLAHDGWVSLVTHAIGGRHTIPRALALFRRHDSAVTSGYEHGFKAKVGRIRGTTPDLFRNEAELRANEATYLEALAATAPQALNERLRAAARFYSRLSRWAGVRRELYASGSLLRRQRSLLQLTLSGCYGGRGYAGYGIQALLKDSARTIMGAAPSGLPPPKDLSA